MIIFINGIHRSGTTFLSRIINALPDTFILKDGLRIPWIWMQVEAPDDLVYPKSFYTFPKIEIDLDMVPSDMSLFRKILNEEIDSHKLSRDVDAALKNYVASLSGNGTYKDAFASFFECLKANTHQSNVGTKSTHMQEFEHSLLDAYPKAKWIEIIRDSRGWYCSSKVSHPSRNCLTGAHFWNRAVDSSIQASEVFPDRHLMVSYEFLITNPVAAIQKICDFLSIDLHIDRAWLDTMVLIENDGSPWSVNSSYTVCGKRIQEDQNLANTIGYEKFDGRIVRRWKKKLSGVEKFLIKRITLKRLKRLGFVL